MDSFCLENIKGFYNSGNIEIKPITIIIGKNSSGKSSLIRFPLVLKQTIQESVSPLLCFGKDIDYGNFEDVVINHDTSLNAKFKININKKLFKFIIGRTGPGNRNSEMIDMLESEINELELTVEVGRKSKTKFIGELEVKSFRVQSGNYNMFSCSIDDCAYGINFMGNYFGRHQVQFDNFIPNMDFTWLDNYIENDESLKRITEEKKEKLVYSIYTFTRAIQRYLQAICENISYIGPFRKTPERSYRYKEASLANVGLDGGYTAEILASNYRRNNNKFFVALNDWLKGYLNITLKVEDLKGDLYRIIIDDLDTNVSNNIIDVGFGLSQVLPIIVQVFMNKYNDGQEQRQRNIFGSLACKRINIIEQPELHLHPAAQASLADLFIKGHQIDKKNNFLIETHSEHLLLRLRRRIIENKIEANDVALYFVDKRKGKNSVVKRLFLDKKGTIDDWPEDFFDQDFKEIMNIKKLLMNMEEGDPKW